LPAAKNFIRADKGNRRGNEDCRVHNKVSVGVCIDVVYYPKEGVEDVPKARAFRCRLGNAHRIANCGERGEDIDKMLVIDNGTSDI